MGQQIEVPGQGVVEFPDEMSDAQIVAAIKKSTLETSGKMALEGMSGMDKFMAGAGKGVTDVGRGLKQFVGLGDQAEIDDSRARDSALAGTGAGMAGEIAGNMASTFLPAGAYAGVAGLAARALPATAASLAASGLIGGATAAATTPVPTGGSRLKEAARGVAGGVAGDLLARGAARLAQPILQSPETKALLAQGIVPTPGQASNAFSPAEEKLTSIPLTGQIIEAGKNRSRNEFNQAILNMGMPDGQKVSQAGNAGMTELKDALSMAYDKAFQGKSVSPDGMLNAAIGAAKAAPYLPMNKNGSRDFDNIVKRIFQERIPQGNTLTAGAMKGEIIGDLGKEAQKFLKSPIRAEQATGEALMAARDEANKWLLGQVAKVDPQAAMSLAKLDPLYKNRIMAGKAVDKAASQGGIFTPYQALKSSQPGTPMRGLADIAQSVMGNKVPNSGTTDRGLMAYLAMHPSSLVNPAEYLGIPISSLMYSRPGSRYMVGDLVPGQTTLSEILRGLSPYTGQVGRASATESNKK